jgi:hypothetical protein
MFNPFFLKCILYLFLIMYELLVDLTGTGAQDAAIGQFAWDTMSKL